MSADDNLPTRVALLEQRMAQSDKVGDEHSKIYERLNNMEGDIKVLTSKIKNSNGGRSARRELFVSGGLATGIIVLVESLRAALLG